MNQDFIAISPDSHFFPQLAYLCIFPLHLIHIRFAHCGRAFFQNVYPVLQLAYRRPRLAMAIFVAESEYAYTLFGNRRKLMVDSSMATLAQNGFRRIHRWGWLSVLSRS